MIVKHRFNVRNFTERAYVAYFSVKLGDQDKSCHFIRCAHIVHKRCGFEPKASSVRCGLGFLLCGENQKITMMIVIFAW